MKDVLEKITYYPDHPIRFSEYDIDEIIDGDKKQALITADILRITEPYKSIICEDCLGHYVEPIFRDDGRIYGMCVMEDGGRFSILQTKLNAFCLDTEKILEIVADELNMAKDVSNIQEYDFWKIGTASIDATTFSVFYIRSGKISKYEGLLESFSMTTKNFIILTNTPHSQTPTLHANSVATFSLSEIVIFQKGKFKIDSKKALSHINSQIRSVLFENGDIFIRGEKLGHIDVSTPNYYFVEILWKHFNSPVSHKDIFDYCKLKLSKKDYETTPQKFCNNRLSSLRKILGNKAKVNSIFTSEKTKKGSTGCKMRPCA